MGGEEAEVDLIERAKGHLKFGNLCARTGRPEKALEHYQSALQLNPSYAAAHHNAGGVCQRMKRFKEATVHYEAALRIKPTLVEAASNLAVAHLNCCEPAEAVFWCRRAIELQAEQGAGLNVEAFHHLNVALRLLGRKQEAIEESWREITIAQGKLERSGNAYSQPYVPPAPVEVPEEPRCHTQPGLLTVVCVKWGSKYDATYVNKLMRGIRRSASAGRTFIGRCICFTDDDSGIDRDILTQRLPEDRAAEGWWHKAFLFSPHAGLSGRVMYVDLDSVVVGSLEPLACYAGRFATLSTQGFGAEEGYADGYNTSIMLWDASDDGSGMGKLSSLYDYLCAAVPACLMRWDHWVEMVVPRAHLLQQLLPGLVVDYRTACLDGSPPASAALVTFPRYPKPHEVDAPWIDEFWQ